MSVKNFFSFIIHLSFLKFSFSQQEFCRSHMTVVQECHKQLRLTKIIKEDEISETRALSIYLEDEKREEILAIDDHNIYDDNMCKYEIFAVIMDSYRNSMSQFLIMQIIVIN